MPSAEGTAKIASRKFPAVTCPAGNEKLTNMPQLQPLPHMPKHLVLCA